MTLDEDGAGHSVGKRTEIGVSSMSVPSLPLLISIRQIAQPVTHQDVERFCEALIEASAWPAHHVTRASECSETAENSHQVITFSQPPGTPHNDLSVTLEYVAAIGPIDSDVTTLTMSIEYNDPFNGDEYAKTYGSTGFDQLGFLASLQRELNYRRPDKPSLQRHTLHGQIDRLRLKLRASQRVEYLLAMHDLYDQLGELGAYSVEVSQAGRGRFHVSADHDHERWYGQSWKFNRVLDAAQLPWEAFVAAGTPVDSVTVALDLTCNPGGLSRETLYTQLHELAGH